MGVRYSFPANLRLSEDCLDLIQKIFAANPSARVTLKGLKSHRWFLTNLPEELKVRLGLGALVCLRSIQHTCRCKSCGICCPRIVLLTNMYIFINVRDSYSVDLCISPSVKKKVAHLLGVFNGEQVSSKLYELHRSALHLNTCWSLMAPVAFRQHYQPHNKVDDATRYHCLHDENTAVFIRAQLICFMSRSGRWHGSPRPHDGQSSTSRGCASYCAARPKEIQPTASHTTAHCKLQ